jgi:DNA-binding NtrC family response regulator
MFVDDSFCALESIKWVFRDEPYHLFAFANPVDALNVIASLKFSVVLAEQSMAEMDGIEFFKKAKQRSPNTLGIIMTSYLDFDKALEALNKGLVYRFIKKPWDCLGLKQAVKTAVAHYEINTGTKTQPACG